MVTKVKTKPRVRRSADEARREILDAAERAFMSGGLDAVRVQTVARDVGVTDAAVHYHFGSREGLLVALLRRAGRGLKDELKKVVAAWDGEGLDLAALVDLMDETYDKRGYARLSMWLQLAGHPPRGAGMFADLVEDLHRSRVTAARREGRRPPPMRDTQFTVELLTLVVWAVAVSGDAWRRAVGLPGDRATRNAFLEWFTDIVESRVRNC